MELALRQGGEWNELLLELESSIDPSEFKELRRIVGNILGTYYEEALRPVLTEHPHLRPPGLFD